MENLARCKKQSRACRIAKMLTLCVVSALCAMSVMAVAAFAADIDAAAFIDKATTVLKAVIILIGAGIAVWGVVNLMEGYSNDNPGAKSQGMKQLMSGIGLIVLALVLVPALETMMETATTT